MFKVYHSNQLDLLKTLMCTLMEQDPLDDPFAKDIVLVQSPGMSQWLNIQMAEHFGIAANIEFPLPATFIWNMFTKVLPGIPKESAFSKGEMSWKLMAILPTCLTDEAFIALSSYLNDDNDKRKIHQLASRIADLFDQYLVYRPQWLAKWQKGEQIEGLGEAQQWQAPLWQKLVAYTAELEQLPWHRGNLYQRFIDTLSNTTQCPKGLPKRVFICGISALPPIYLQALQALGQHIDVHLMFNNPCRHYWGDIQDLGFLAKLQSRYRHDISQQQHLPLLAPHSDLSRLFEGDIEQQWPNPLLGSWGKLGRDNLYLLQQMDQVHEISAFVDIAPDNLLHAVQHDMLELLNHAESANRLDALLSSQHKRILDPQDRSISFHVCHSPQREVEILYDQLLDRLSKDPSLLPKDIIVMVADIDRYTPHIQAVFGDANYHSRLPYAISDRQASQAHPILQGVLALLNLPESRFTVESVLSLLEIPALATQFAIKDDDLPCLRDWIIESGIRWGLNEEAVNALDLPNSGHHTWEYGVSRMLLGYAMNSEKGLWNNTLPFDESSGMAATLAGCLAQLLTRLTQWRERLMRERTIAQWKPVCRQLLSDFFVDNEEHSAILDMIDDQWQTVLSFGEHAQYQDEVPLTLLQDEMNARLSQARISQRFLAGQINFCTLMPMRSIPFKVVCLLGMNDGVYPRTLPPLGFDLMANDVKRGDRSRRDDDRYLFLEAVLSAESQLYISYIGRAIHDNSERYPSVLVTELLEYLEQSHCLAKDRDLSADESAKELRSHLLHYHSRMPFSPEQFDPAYEYQSYGEQWLPAALGQGEAQSSFVLDKPLASLTPLTTVDLEQLIRFYRHPVRGFFQQRLGVYFSLEEIELPEDEPFTVDALANYQFSTQLLSRLIDNEEATRLFEYLTASGVLPYGAYGALYWDSMNNEMEGLAQRIKAERAESRRSMDIDINIDGIQLTGWIHDVQEDGLVRWRSGTTGLDHGLALWIEHLAYCASGGCGQSRLFGRKEGEWRFNSVEREQAITWLSDYIHGYQQGLESPLLLLNRTGAAWLLACFNKKTSTFNFDDEQIEKANNKLLEAWLGGLHNRGECSDLYLQRVLPTLQESDMTLIAEQAKRFFLPVMNANVAAEPNK